MNQQERLDMLIASEVVQVIPTYEMAAGPDGVLPLPAVDAVAKVLWPDIFAPSMTPRERYVCLRRHTQLLTRLYRQLRNEDAVEPITQIARVGGVEAVRSLLDALEGRPTRTLKESA